MPVSSIRGHSRYRFISIWICVAIAVSIRAPVAGNGNIDAIESITSKRIYSIHAWKDSIWLVTPKGINIGWDRVAGKGIDTAGVSWWGYRTTRGVLFNERAVHARGPHAEIAVAWHPDTVRRHNPFWIYPGQGDEFGLVNPVWNDVIFRDTTAFRGMPDDFDGFWTYDMAADDSTYWCAYGYGGLVAIDAPLSIQQDSIGFRIMIAQPHQNDSSFTTREYVVDKSARFPSSAQIDSGFTTLLDTSFFFHSVAVDTVRKDTRVWGLTRKRIWEFDPATRQWYDRSANITTTKGFTACARIYTSSYSSEQSPVVTTLHVSATNDTTEKIFYYDSARGTWTQRAEFETVNACAFGSAYSDQGPVQALYVVHEGSHLEALSIEGNAGLLSASAQIYASERALNARHIYDIAFVPHSEGDDGYLWIATDNGLFYSRNEVKDQRERNELLLAAKPPGIGAGLSETYAYPTILNEKNEKVCIAYNLSKSAKVTIEIFDWNMDFVTSLTDAAMRIAGTRSRTGRSAHPVEDCWDGTDVHGNEVAPGVYYYKVISHAGGASFGKIVVAR